MIISLKNPIRGSLTIFDFNWYSLISLTYWTISSFNYKGTKEASLSADLKRLQGIFYFRLDFLFSFLIASIIFLVFSICNWRASLVFSSIIVFPSSVWDNLLSFPVKSFLFLCLFKTLLVISFFCFDCFKLILSFNESGYSLIKLLSRVEFMSLKGL